MTTGRGSYGGWMGDEFDDGVNDDVRKVIVGEDSLGVVSIKIEYVKDGNVVSREHGRSTGTQITEVFKNPSLSILKFIYKFFFFVLVYSDF